MDSHSGCVCVQMREQRVGCTREGGLAGGGRRAEGGCQRGAWGDCGEGGGVSEAKRRLNLPSLECVDFFLLRDELSVSRILLGHM